MRILLFIVAGIFALFGLGTFMSFIQSRNIGLLLAAIVFGTAAGAAIGFVSWWSLLAGFILSWIPRLSGADPSYR